MAEAVGPGFCWGEEDLSMVLASLAILSHQSSLTSAIMCAQLLGPAETTSSLSLSSPDCPCGFTWDVGTLCKQGTKTPLGERTTSQFTERRLTMAEKPEAVIFSLER